MPRIAPFEEHAERYDAWFVDHAEAYDAELRAVAELVPARRRALPALEVGVGSGRFAAPLGIGLGLDPSSRMLRLARERGVEAVVAGVGEALPFGDGCVELVLLVTTVCFLDDMEASLREARRVLAPAGAVIVGLVDRDGPIGRAYQEGQADSVFYRQARLYSVGQVVDALRSAGFGEFQFRQTLFGPLEATPPDEPVKPGHGEGSFVVIRALVPA